MRPLLMARLRREAFVALAQVAIGNQRLDDGHQQLLCRAGAVRLRHDDELMRRIDGRHPASTLG